MTHINTTDWVLKKEFFNYVIHQDYYIFLKAELKKYRQHGKTSTFVHCRDVAYISFLQAKKHGLEYNDNFSMEKLISGALCHDFFMYDWHERGGNHKLHGFTHPHTSAENARNYFNLGDKEISMIESHMWPLTITKIPKSKEAWIICFIDKIISLKETIKR